MNKKRQIFYIKEIIFNAKTRRVSVCNALDCLIIHEKRLSDLPTLCEKLAEKEAKRITSPSGFVTFPTGDDEVRKYLGIEPRPQNTHTTNRMDNIFGSSKIIEKNSEKK